MSPSATANCLRPTLCVDRLVESVHGELDQADTGKRSLNGDFSSGHVGPYPVAMAYHADSDTRDDERHAVEAIDSPRHPAVRRVTDILRAKTRNPKTVVVDDEENILQAIRSGIRLDSLYFTQDVEAAADTIRGRARDPLPGYLLSNDVAKGLFGGEKRSRMFALATAPKPSRLSDLLTRSGDIIVLDGVRLVGNIGAITRTASALGAAGIVLIDSGLSTVLDRRLVRASRGLIFALPVAIATRQEVSDFLQREHIPAAVLAADAQQPLSAIKELDERVALVMGAERIGHSDELAATAQRQYSIPMSSEVESLNVSVATALALYEHRER